MLILTKQHQIRSIAERWRDQYFDNGTWKFCKGGAEAIYNQLVKLPNSATEEDIAKVIGNGSWTKIGCDSCGESVDVVAIFDDDYVCLTCLRAALAACESLTSPSVPVY